MANSPKDAVSDPAGSRTCFDKFFGCLKRSNQKEQQKLNSAYADTTPPPVKLMGATSVNPPESVQKADPQNQPFSVVQRSITDMRRESSQLPPTPENIFTKGYNPHKGLRGKIPFEQRVTVGNIFENIPKVDLSQAYNMKTVQEVMASVVQNQQSVMGGAPAVANNEDVYRLYNLGSVEQSRSRMNGGTYQQNPPTILVRSYAPRDQTPLEHRPLYKEFLKRTQQTNFTSQTVTNRGGCSLNIKLENTIPNAEEGEAEKPRHIYCVEDGCLYLGLYDEAEYGTITYPFLPKVKDRPVRVQVTPVILYPNGQKYTGTVQSSMNSHNPQLFCRYEGRLERDGAVIQEGEWNALDEFKQPPQAT